MCVCQLSMICAFLFCIACSPYCCEHCTLLVSIFSTCCGIQQFSTCCGIQQFSLGISRCCLGTLLPCLGMREFFHLALPCHKHMLNAPHAQWSHAHGLTHHVTILQRCTPGSKVYAASGARILWGLCSAGLTALLHSSSPATCGIAALQLGLRQQH